MESILLLLLLHMHTPLTIYILLACLLPLYTYMSTSLLYILVAVYCGSICTLCYLDAGCGDTLYSGAHGVNGC